MFASEPVVIASLDICHSRPIAPTRRVSLGQRDLPVSPAPGAGGVLLAGIMAHSAPEVEPELREDLMSVLDSLAAGLRVIQPRVRHRFQTDQVGLSISPQRLVSVDGTLEFEFDNENARPVQLALGAVYAAASLPRDARKPVFEALTSALVWGRPVDNSFITWMMDGRAGELLDLRAWNNPLAWAMEILELEGDPDEAPSKRVVQRRFRTLLREAHPDHGGLSDDAAARISDLTEARRILLAS